ncbi:MAG TPA: hypothetical protein VFS19_02745 [Planctomycetota bacterium]|nr:hypothetical protein [Planctomycetota bacterium]
MLGFLLLPCGCSSPYNIRLSDGRSVSYGPLFFFGWSDPPLIPGTRLIDAPSGSRLVLWNDGLEAIVDLGETCPVLVADGDRARAPSSDELALLAVVFPAWPLEPSSRVADYAAERRLERRFPSHLRTYAEKLEPPALAAFAVGESPAGWLALGGRSFTLSLAAAQVSAEDLPRILDRALSLNAMDRGAVLRSLLARAELAPDELIRIARAGEAEGAAKHKSTNEAVCMAAVDEIAKRPLSSSRRQGLVAVLESPGITPRVREKILEVPLPYPEDREAVRARVSRKQ